MQANVYIPALYPLKISLINEKISTHVIFVSYNEMRGMIQVMSVVCVDLEFGRY